MENKKITTSTQNNNSPPVGKFRTLYDYGFSVFPLKPRKKKPRGPWEQYQAARPTPGEIDTWERELSNHEVAGVCGAVSGVVGLDIDTPDGQQEAEQRGLPRTPSVKTGKGRHYYFKHPGVEVHNFAKGRGGKEKFPGIDFRGDGGYVVGPGSVHEDTGTLYSWEISPDESDFAEMPSWLLEYVTDTKKNERKGTTTTRTDEKTYQDTTRYDKYVQAALDGERDKVRSAHEGERNDTLNRAAFSIGQLVAGGFLTEENATAELTAAGLETGLATDEVRSTVRSGLNAGMKEPRTIPDATERNEYHGGNGNTATWRTTDLGNSERLVYHYGKKLRYNHTRKCWLFWDGTRWATDESGKAEALAKKTARGILNEAKQFKGEAYGEILKWAAQSENATRITGMMKLATSDRTIAVTQAELDCNGWLLNLKNGTYDLQSGSFRQHEQADLLTRVSPVAYDPAAECPTWLAFLNRVFDENTEVIFFIQQALGYSLTADTTEQCFFMLWGSGRNGKSTLMNLVQWLLGDYAQTTRFETLLTKRTDTVGDDLAPLDGARLVCALEGEYGRTLAESLVKQLTGGDPIAARFLYGNYFNFVPRFKLWLATNHRPNIRGTDLAIWRRVKLIPFTVTIPEDEVDVHLSDKLKAEGSGILNWLLAGVESWQERGLITPDTINAATAEYRAEMDILSDWMNECCEIGPQHRDYFSALRESYMSWCTENKEREISKTAFKGALTERGFDTTRGTGNKVVVRGIRAKTEDIFSASDHEGETW